MTEFKTGDRVQIVSESKILGMMSFQGYVDGIWIPQEMVRDITGKTMTIEDTDTNYFIGRGWMIPYSLIEGYAEDKAAAPSVISSEIDDILNF